MTPNDRQSGFARLPIGLVVSLALGCGLGCVGNIQTIADEAALAPNGDPTQAQETPIPTPAGCTGTVNPGHVTIHRLNRVEYNNTIRDLLGDNSKPADELPADDAAGGFRNNSEVLNVNSDLLLQYEGVSRRLAEKAVAQSGFITCDPAVIGEIPCATQVLESFARRAWRRPLTPEEKGDIASLVQQVLGDGNPFGKAMTMAVQAVLLSPNFLYRAEYPPATPGGAPYSVDAYALASRLSYFLWSSMPDTDLFAAAESGALAKLDLKELGAQVARMLANKKASGLVDNLASDWLFGHKADQAAPFIGKFPQYYDTTVGSLRTSMQKEVWQLVNEFLQKNLDLRKMLDANFTFVKERLAQHYKIPGIKGGTFQRVTWPASSGRAGLLTQAQFLVATSNADEPSIPRRGVHVLGNFLCVDFPPPKPNVAAEQAKIDKALGATPTRREKAEARDARDCGGCHNQFNPIGLGLEVFNAIGGLRGYDEEDPMKRAIDGSGKLGGLTFASPTELAHIIRSDSRLPACMTNAMFRYALGRGTTSDDQCLLDDITRSTVDKGFLAQDVIAALVASPAFRYQAP